MPKFKVLSIFVILFVLLAQPIFAQNRTSNAISMLMRERDKANQQILNLTQQQKQNKDQIDKLWTQTRTQKNPEEIAKLVQKIHELEDKNKNIEKDISNQKNKFNDLENQIKQMQKEIADHERRIKELEEANKRKEEDNKRKQQEIENLKKAERERKEREAREARERAERERKEREAREEEARRREEEARRREDKRILPGNRVWEWNSDVKFITIDLGPRVRIHCRPDVNAPAPSCQSWSEHPNCEVSIFDIQPGPGSTRGWGLLQSFRHTRDGWVNLDYASVLWTIWMKNGEKIKFWHWENGVDTPDVYVIKNASW